ncbi:hypothetical protein FB107DRAFT_258504, partial [Schizophyllum commune]
TFFCFPHPLKCTLRRSRTAIVCGTSLPFHITQNEVLQTVHLLKAEDERVERPVHDALQLARTVRGPSAPDEVEKRLHRIPLAMLVAVGKDGVQSRRFDLREEPVRVHVQLDAAQGGRLRVV